MCVGVTMISYTAVSIPEAAFVHLPVRRLFRSSRLPVVTPEAVLVVRISELAIFKWPLYLSLESIFHLSSFTTRQSKTEK